MQANIEVTDQERKASLALIESKRQLKLNIVNLLDQFLVEGNISISGYDERTTNFRSIKSTLSFSQLGRLKENLIKEFRGSDCLNSESIEGSVVNSHLHGDPEPTARIHTVGTPFQEFRIKYLSKVQAYNESVSVNQSVPIGELDLIESRFVYSDYCGVKRTRWFPENQISIRRRSLNKKGFYIHQICKRRSNYDALLTSSNEVVHELNFRESI